MGQLWEIVSLPDNVPIVFLLVLVPFFLWYGLRQAFANDRLIARLEADPQLAKTHYRKNEPFREGWDQKIHVWPYLLRIELLAAVIVTLVLMVWSITLNAPQEGPANPNLTMNPAKAPWYFLGVQEMLLYFDPWIAGVVMPTLIIMGFVCDSASKRAVLKLVGKPTCRTFFGSSGGRKACGSGLASVTRPGSKPSHTVGSVKHRVNPAVESPGMRSR